MHVRSAEQRNNYFRELTINLRHEGFAAGPEKDSLLPAEQDGQPLCLIMDSGGVRYREKDVVGGSSREALERVTDTARVTAEYMSQMETAPSLKAGSLEGDYRLLADFNNTILAGHMTKYGVQFITWDRSPDGTSLNQGHYYGPDCGAEGYAAAKQDFAVRSGLLPTNFLFTKEQLQQSGHFEYDANLEGFYDYRRYGEQLVQEECGQFNECGYVAYHGSKRPSRTSWMRCVPWGR